MTSPMSWEHLCKESTGYGPARYVNVGQCYLLARCRRCQHTLYTTVPKVGHMGSAAAKLTLRIRCIQPVYVRYFLFLKSK
ncbi:hypothetical protein EMCRGX_G007840 [Ephydatia muelleri]